MARRPKPAPSDDLPWLPERAREEFWSPVPLADGRQLVTLQDAADYVADLPIGVLQSDDRWRDVVHDIRMVGAGRFPLLFVEIGLTQAIHKPGPPEPREKPRLRIGKRLPRKR